ncbi:uncharacterized protein PG986_000704 [Apiospora aurea]|uniref:Uncharacterized protein n=1 Tax=Apiospora aurea TaxID=335848 RepID=A0ABR1QUR4_9PEZI
MLMELATKGGDIFPRNRRLLQVFNLVGEGLDIRLGLLDITLEILVDGRNSATGSNAEGVWFAELVYAKSASQNARNTKGYGAAGDERIDFEPLMTKPASGNGSALRQMRLEVPTSDPGIQSATETGADGKNEWIARIFRTIVADVLLPASKSLIDG